MSSASASPKANHSSRRTERPVRLVLSCEHGGNRIPRAWAGLFAGAGAGAALASHRGWDRGALELARALARRLQAPLVAATTSRLLVDLNRSPGHRALFSRWTRALDARERVRILANVYWPHRRAVVRALGRPTRGAGPVLHVAVHSFVPVLRGERRRADLGLLYDPRRRGERALCARWRERLLEADPRLRVRRNYPYRGAADGLTRALRRVLPERDYLGIELEVNQRLLARADAVERRALVERLAGSLTAAYSGSSR